MPLPLAYFLTWTCYGTRLHGDDRGSVDRAHNVRGTPVLAPDPRRNELASGLMMGDVFVLSTQGRSVVEHAIRDHCDIRDWELLSLNVRTTHVHVVVNCHGRTSPEQAMSQFKSWGTRRLTGAGLAARGRKLWTDHGSTRWINHGNGLMLAIDYVRRWQGSVERFECEAAERTAFAELLARLDALEREAAEARAGTPSACAEGSSAPCSSQ